MHAIIDMHEMALKNRFKAYGYKTKPSFHPVNALYDAYLYSPSYILHLLIACIKRQA